MKTKYFMGSEIIQTLNTLISGKVSDWIQKLWPHVRLSGVFVVLKHFE